MPDCSATGRIFLIYPKGSWNSSLVGSNTGASGGTVNSNSCADPFNLSLEGHLEKPLALSPLDTIVSMISMCHNKFIKQFLTKIMFILLYWLHFDDPNPHDVSLFRQQRRFRPFMSKQNCPPAHNTNTQQPPSENVEIENTMLSISLPHLRFYRQLADTETITRVTNIKSLWVHVYFVQALTRDRKLMAVTICSLSSKSIVSYTLGS